jgi:vacuolar protein sorting-associated protein 26
MAALLDRRPPRYPFDFSNAEKPYESYNGLNVRLRYFIRVTVTRGYPSGNLVKEQDFVVQRDGSVRSFVVPPRRRDARSRNRRSRPPRPRRRVAQPAPEVNNTIKMEVGIEECLHIEFEYDKTKYHLNDIIIGKVYFLLVRIKIKHMELAIIRREAAGSGPQMYNDSETITKFEVMDGAPVRGECIPIRLFLSNFVRARRVRLLFCFFLSRSYYCAEPHADVPQHQQQV